MALIKLQITNYNFVTQKNVLYFSSKVYRYIIYIKPKSRNFFRTRHDNLACNHDNNLKVILLEVSLVSFFCIKKGDVLKLTRKLKYE